MTITARGKKRGLPAHALRDLEAKGIAPEAKRAFEIGNLEMRVADADGGRDGSLFHRGM